MRFKVGDIVRIHKKHMWYGENNLYSPSDTNGKIVRIEEFSTYPIVVKWDNKKKNIFNESELRLYRRDNAV